MKNIPFDTVNLLSDDILALEKTYSALKEKFSVALINDADHFVNKFELFNNLKSAKVGGTLFVNHPKTDSYLNFIKSSFTYGSGNYGRGGGQTFAYDRYQVWAFVTLDQDYGRMLIRKETLADKMLQLVHPTELKIKEDEVFRSNFHVEANIKEKATALLNANFRSLLINMMYQNFVIEIAGKTLVIRNNQMIDAEATVHLATLANSIANLKN